MLKLSEYNIGKRTKLDTMVIDEFRRDSFLLDNLFFDDAVSANGNGSTLSYGYTKIATPSGASTRPINSEYTPNDAKRIEELTHLVIMGGSFQLDRVVALNAGAIDEVGFQLRDKIKSTAAFFNYMALNGVAAKDSATDSYTAFDGLTTLLTGADTEVTSAAVLTAIDNAKSIAFLSEIDEMLSLMADAPDALVMNRKLLNKFKAAARLTSYFTQSEDAFGRAVDTYNGIPLIDAGSYYDKSTGTTVDAVPVASGKTDLFAINMSRDGFVGVTTQGGQGFITSRMPDFSNAAAVQLGSVEMVASVALKNTKKAAVLRGITL